jgi:glycosyltransferase involved in cell wall biosynthesis
MSRRLKFSIVTPSYNQGKYIRGTIDSVLGQEGDFEYFVFDGGSTDGTVTVLGSYGERFYWASERDRGQSDAINKGFARASGDVLAYLNSDDIYYPGALAAAGEYLMANPEVDIVYGDANHIDEQDNVIAPYPTEPYDFETLTARCFLCQPAVFLRRRVYERCGGMDLGLPLSLDYEYWIRASQAGMQFGWLRKVLAGSRLHADTKTLGSRVRVHKEINDMLKRRLGKVPDAWLYSYAHAALDAKGMPRGTRKFALRVGMLSLAAAIRWNRRITAQMRNTVMAWMGV